jgi:hypothetical protein
MSIRTRTGGRAAYRATERDVRAQVLERDGHTCLLCGTRHSPTLHHVSARGMGGTRFPIDARLGICVHGSGTTGCHSAIERQGREDGWAYNLGYLLRHGRQLEQLRADPDLPWLVWGHADRVWWELTAAGTRLPVPQLSAPDRTLLAALGAVLPRAVRG